MKHLMLTFRRENGGTLRCSSPKKASQFGKTLDEVLDSGFAVENMVQGREDDDYDILLVARS